MCRGFVLSLIVLSAAVAAAPADLAPGPWPWQQTPTPRPWGHGAPPPGWIPQPAAPIQAPLVIEPTGAGDAQTRLQLPGSLIKRLQADAGVVGEAPRGWAATPTGTVVAGLALSVALVLGGLWIVRRPQRRWIGAVVTAATLAVIGFSGCLPCWTDYRMEEPVHRLNPGTDDVLAGQALLEVSDKDDSARLMIDPEDLAAWAGKAAAAPADAGATKK